MGIQNLPYLTENICSYSNSRRILGSLLQVAWGEKVINFLLLSISLENNYFHLELIGGHGINLLMKTIEQLLYCIDALP